MASHHDVVQRVLWLKTKLSSDPLPEIAKIIRLLQKLSRLPVDVEVLQETGIGKCVNGLKKKCPDISVYVKPLIQSWKAVVQRAMLAEAAKKQSEDGLENGDDVKRDEEEAASPRSPSDSPVPDDEVPSPPSGSSSPDQNDGQNYYSDRSDEEREHRHDSSSPLHWMSGRNTFDSYVPKGERQEISPDHQQKSRKGHDSLSNESPPKKQKMSPKFKSSNEDMNRRKEKCNDSGSPIKPRTDHMDSQPGKKSTLNSSSIHRKLDSKNKSPKQHIDSYSTHGKSALSKPILSEQHASYSKPGKCKTIENITSNILLNEKKVFSKGGKMDRDGAKGKNSSERSSVSKPKKILSKAADVDDSGMLFQPDFLKSEKVSPSIKKASGHQLEKTNTKKNIPRIDETDSSCKVRDADVYKVKKDKKPVKSEPREKMYFDEKVEKKIVHSEKRQSPSRYKHESDTRGSKGDALVKKNSSSGQSKKSSRDKVKPSKSSSDKPSLPSKPSNENDHEERTFENTGMSFEDCLFGGSVPKVVKKSKPSGGSRTKDNSTSQDRTPTGDRKTGKNKENKLKKQVKEQNHSKNQLEREGKTSSKRKIDEGMNSKGSVKKMKDSPPSKSNEVREASASEVDLTLPDIQPDYKPLRLPEIKPSERRKTAVDSESELSLKWFGSKQTKTKVYSGKARKRHWENVPSLQDICKEVIFDNIDALYETGGVPFHVMEDVLEKCTAQQLLKIEDYNPDYMLESDHLWKRHVEKTFKGSEPEEMESWKDLYVRKSDEREHKLLAITANISASMAKKETGRLTKLAFVDRPVKPPRNVIRQQIRHGTSTSSSPAKAPKPKKPAPGESSSHRVIPNKEPAPPVQRQRTAKVVAPMMQKSLKLMKRVTSRR